MNKIINYFEYDNFVDIIEKNIIDKNEDKIMDEIMNKLYNNEYLMKLNNKIKTAAEALKSIKMINENEAIEYKDDIEIINNKVKNFINESLGDIYIVDTKFLFGDQKIIMDYKLVINSVIIGNFENNTFKSEILLNFYQKNYKVNYFQIFQTKGYNIFINELKSNNYELTINENEVIEVNVQKINNHENNQFPSNSNNNKENGNAILNSNNINDYQNNNFPSLNNNHNDIIDRENDVLSQYNEHNFDLESNNPSGTNKEEVDNNDNDNDNNIIERQYSKKTKLDKTKETIREYENNLNRKIELSIFTQNQIKALILYYIFYLNLEQDVKNSKINIKSSECYLINETWMNEFKNFYLYKNLVNNIQNIITKLNLDINSESIEKTIYDNLDEGYIKEVNEKGSKYNDLFEDKEKIHFKRGTMLDEYK